MRRSTMALRQYTYKPKHFIVILILLFLTLFFLSLTSSCWKPSQSRHYSYKTLPEWYKIVSQKLKGKIIKVALVNTDEINVSNTVKVHFERISNERKWEAFFPEWIDEDERWGQLNCPDIPMPAVGMEEYDDIDVVVAGVPCGGDGRRDVFRLQVNLVVANLTVQSGCRNTSVDQMVYVVFVGSCGPMMEIFRCDDLMWHGGEYWVYKPDLERLKHKLLMPVGSCMIAPQEHITGNGVRNKRKLGHLSKEAYVTLLHSSEKYVCGAIVLAQSIIQTNTTKDLLILVDDSISPLSLHGLRAVGWKIKHIKRIRSPHAEKGAYNEWNYSKLRIWQLTEYEKIIFIDADLIVLKNMDNFFSYPQLSVTGNDKHLFNSGVMLVEPSTCMFKTLMKKRFTFKSYNGGDQGFLNEMFTWWHRWHSSLNHLKVFVTNENPNHVMPSGLYTIHYLGLKPWMCYEDYDCNWDMLDHHAFASDDAHQMWWNVYNNMDDKLKPYCALTKKMDERIKKWRLKAENAKFVDEHWKINVKDERQWLGFDRPN